MNKTTIRVSSSSQIQQPEGPSSRSTRRDFLKRAAMAVAAGSIHYQDYQLYSNAADPAQIVNLAGRSAPSSLVHYTGDHSIQDITAHLRERLIARMVEAGEQAPADQTLALLSVSRYSVLIGDQSAAFVRTLLHNLPDSTQTAIS